MTPQELEAIGQALYGRRWRSRMAEVLGRDRSCVSRWARPEGHPQHRPIPGVAATRIEEISAPER